MGRRANLQKSDGGRVPHGFAYANYALGIGVCVVIGVRQLRRRIWPPSRQGRGRPNPTQFRLYERTYPPEGGERRSPKGIVRSYEKRGVEDLRVPLTGPFDPVRGAPSLVASTTFWLVT